MTKDEVFVKVAAILVDYLRLKGDEVTAQSHVINDLGADSLALVELGFKFMEAFGIGMIAPEDENLVVGNLVEHISQLIPA
ncbi:MAG TPA: phosphopantetheine-binding protein [Polyangiaceae bacterium]